MTGHPLTAQAKIRCSHGGTVKPVPSQSLYTIGGQPVLVLPDLIGAPIPDCPLKPPLTPCTLTVSVLADASPLTTVQDKQVVLDTATGLTNGTPPATFLVAQAGQTAVTEQ